MNLYEYQAKELFAEAGLATPRGIVVERSADWRAAIASFGAPCAVKAQMLSGKRGKAGLVRIARTSGEALEAAEHIFARSESIRQILVEEAIDYDKELYLSISVDPVGANALIMASSEGGVDIEELAAKAPEKLIGRAISLERGIMAFEARGVAYDLGLKDDTAKKFAALLGALYKVFSRYDAELAEINPLFLTKDGFVAGDGKIAIDDNSMFRQKRFSADRGHFESDMAYEAHLEGIPYLQFDGDISLMCAGAGLTTTVYDLINYAGGTVANYLEFGGPNYKKAVRAMELCLKNESAKVILIVTFGTIARADVMAEGIRDAIGQLKPDIPIIACIRGTNEEAATEILRDCGLEPIFDTEQAVLKAVRLAKEGAV